MSAVQTVLGPDGIAAARSRNQARIRHLFPPPHIKSPRYSRRGHAAARPERTLPAELWAMVWSLLHITDRVSVLHVCSSWRRMAKESPSVWAHVDYYHAPPKYLLCGEECWRQEHAWESHFTAEQLEGLDNVSGFNTKFIGHFIRFSGTTRLFLSLQVIVRDSDAQQMAELARILRPHSARIASIDVVAWSGTFPAILLDQLDALTGLLSLTVSRVKRNLVETGDVPITSKPDSLPALEELSLGPPENVLPLQDGFTGPNLHTITFHVSDVRQIVRALRTCPRLHTLSAHLKLGDEGTPDEYTVMELASCSAQLKHLCLKTVITADEDWILNGFKLDALTTLELEYFQESDPPCASAWRTFGALSDGITLELTHEGDNITICGTDIRGFSRAITVDGRFYDSDDIPALFQELWTPDVLSTRKIKRLELDLTDFFDFIDAFPDDNRVEEIELFAFDISHPGLLVEASGGQDSPRFFPVMAKLCLVRADTSLPAFPKKALRFLERYLSLEVDYDGLKFTKNQPRKLDVDVWPRT